MAMRREPGSLPYLARYPELRREALHHDNGAVQTWIELRSGPAGWATVKRADDAVDRLSEWFGWEAFASAAEAEHDFELRIPSINSPHPGGHPTID
jgi:hypothetical protein